MSFAPPELKLVPFKIPCLQKSALPVVCSGKGGSRKVLKDTTLVINKFE